MCDWIEEQEYETSISIMSLGCGNGNLLLELHERGFTNLMGCDYSAKSVLLSEKVAKQQEKNITYTVLDILNPGEGHSYDLLLDKGTFDAICLNSEAACKSYPSAVASMLKHDGVLLITSCNWTQTELVELFKGVFEKFDQVKYPTFSFGGQTGSTIATVAFRLIK
jgi:SAM-dependent methyltransferase